MNNNLSGLKALKLAIAGTTDSNGILTVNVTNQFTQVPNIISNISDSLVANYTLTVSSRTSTTISIRVRSKSDNTAIINTVISSTALIIGV